MFNSDFTTAHIEHTDREGAAEPYSGERDTNRWARKIRVRWNGR